MTQHAREPAYRREFANYADRAFGWLDNDLEFADDPLLAIAYVISEWAIMVFGPLFWICLTYLLLFAELGH
jgi:hypothetical protein